MHILNSLLLVGFLCFFKKYYLSILKLGLCNMIYILICHLSHVNVLLCLGYLMEMTECMFIVLLMM